MVPVADTPMARTIKLRNVASHWVTRAILTAPLVSDTGAARATPLLYSQCSLSKLADWVHF